MPATSLPPVEGLSRDGAPVPGSVNTDFTGPVNLGNPVEFTMVELAKQVRAITGSESALVNAELPADDPRQRKPDISKAGTFLGWSPRTSLEEGLRRTVAYFQEVTRAADRA